MASQRSQFEVYNATVLTLAAGNTGTSTVVDKGSYHTCTVQINITLAGTTGTYIIEGSIDNVNWVAIPYRTPASDTSSNASIVLTSAAVNLFYLDPKYVQYVRVRCTVSTGQASTTTIAVVF